MTICLPHPQKELDSQSQHIFRLETSVSIKNAPSCGKKGVTVKTLQEEACVSLGLSLKHNNRSVIPDSHITKQIMLLWRKWVRKGRPYHCHYINWIWLRRGLNYSVLACSTQATQKYRNTLRTRRFISVWICIRWIVSAENSCWSKYVCV